MWLSKGFASCILASDSEPLAYLIVNRKLKFLQNFISLVVIKQLYKTQHTVVVGKHKAQNNTPMKKYLLIILIQLIFLSGYSQGWVQKGFDIDGEVAGGSSGSSVSMSDDGQTVVIGAVLNNGTGTEAGHVRVYEWNGIAWLQKGIDIDAEAAYDWSGYSVSISDGGNTIAIGAIYNNGTGTNSGHVRVYEWDGSASVWIQKGFDIDGEAAFDRSGHSISMSNDGNTIVIGAVLNNGTGTEAGHVRVYEWNGIAWLQKGIDIDGEAAIDRNGYSVSMSSDGNTIVIGAPFNDDSGTDAGHVRVYEWDGSAWMQKGLDIDGESANDWSGSSVSINDGGNTVVIGALNNDNSGTNAGHVRIFEWDGTTSAWIQKGGNIDGEAVGDRYGNSVSISSDGNTITTGGIYNNGTTGSNSGHTRIYEWDGSAWMQKGLDIDGESANDCSGSSVSMNGDGNTIVIGAIYNADSGIDAGHVRIYKFCTTTYNTDTKIACESFTWINGITYTSDNNTAIDTLINIDGCDSVINLNLTIYPTYLINQNNSICQGDSILIYGTYQNTTGIYYDSLQTINGCDSIFSTTLTINSLPNVSLASFNPDTLCVNASAVTFPTGSPTGGNYSGAGIGVGNFYPLFAGVGTHDIIYTYTDANSCINSDTTVVYVEVCTVGINESTHDFGIIIYPNPSTGQFTIEKPSDLNNEVQVKLLDATSKLILEKTIPIGKQKIEMDIRNYSKGIYYLQLILDDEIFVKQILKN
ncbi:MAG: hypothetical protein COB15_17185 [Flavobacteriales bacterium]|nr:MAG: hypothetical protein COB15_17185 [Flavobacteriales bacterium]